MSEFYLTNDAVITNVSTWRGAWDDTTTIPTPVTKKLSRTIGTGGFATIGRAESSVTNNWDIPLGRWVSDPLTNPVTFTGGGTPDTWQAVFGCVEDNTSANDFSHIHIYITDGDLDSVYKTIITNAIASDAEWDNPTALGNLFNNSAANNIITTVDARVGDRIVVEIGYQAQNTSSTAAYTGTMNYGGSSGADLQNNNGGSTSPTANPGWMSFSNAQPSSSVSPSASVSPSFSPSLSPSLRPSVSPSVSPSLAPYLQGEQQGDLIHLWWTLP